MESLIANILTPENVRAVIVVVVGMFAKDFVVGMFRRVAKRFLTDKDPKNDVVGEVLNQAADSIEKVRLPVRK